MFLRSSRKSHQSSKLDAGEFEILDCDDERPASNDRLVANHHGTPSQIIKNIQEVSNAQISNLRHTPQSGAFKLADETTTFAYSRVDASISRMVPYLCQRIKRSFNVVDERTQGIASND